MLKWIGLAAVVGVTGTQLFHDPKLPWHFESCSQACELASSSKETFARFGEERTCNQFRLIWVSNCPWTTAYDTGNLNCKVNWAQHRETRCVKK
jgi:hypothetical protein